MPVDTRSDMKFCVVLNALFVSDYAFRPFSDGVSAFLRALDAARGYGRSVYIILREGYKLPFDCGDVRVLSVPFSALGFAEALSRVFEESSCDFAVIMAADSPFFCRSSADAMIEQHAEFFADYSLAEGYPAGAVPEIISLRAVSAVRRLAEGFDGDIGRSLLFDIIKKDINSFDIETVVSEHDVRLLRPAFFADCKRNFAVCEAFLPLFSPDMDAEDFSALVIKNRGLLRSFPAYYQVEVVRGCTQACSYCPYPSFTDVLGQREFMSVERFSSVVSGIAEFSDDAVVGLSAFGELALHPDAVSLVASVLSYEGLSVLVETSGYGWDSDVLRDIAALEGSSRISWIVSLDAIEPEVYRSVRGDGLEDVLACIDLLESLFPDRVFLQAVRLKETEDYLESFYRSLKEKGHKVIIAQYDSFCDSLPDRMVVDISPVDRFPCWHLARDFFVMIDGSVPICKERFAEGPYVGNVFKDGIAAVWDRLKEYWDMHVKETYPDFCLSCKEYFNFNF